MHKLKVFGLAALAVFALTAVSASAAQAAPLFHVEEAPATITGEQIGTQVFNTEEGKVECKVAKFTGTSNVTATATQELAPEYKECTAFGFVGATVNPEGCKYRFNLVEGSSPPTATVDVVCPSGQSIKVSTLSCVVSVGSQTGLSHAVFANNGSGETRDLKVSVTVSGVAYTASSGCSKPGSFTNGTLNGEATVKADSGSSQQGLWVE
ncbi:MAG TPA: hypothetical protein VF731_04625 [Solirubrobacterales bacterium]